MTGSRQLGACRLFPALCCGDLLFPFRVLLFPGFGAGCQPGLQHGQAGILQGQAEPLRAHLPAAEAEEGIPGNGKGGETLLPGAVAEIEIAQLSHQLRPGDLRGGQAEEQGRSGTERKQLRSGKAPFPQQRQGPGHNGTRAGDAIRLIQHKQDPQRRIGSQLVQQGQLPGFVQPLRVQNAEAEVFRQLIRPLQSGQQRAPSRAGDADGQLIQRSHGGTS